MNIVIDGQLVSYSDEGKGRVIVLLHGWGQTKKTFDDLARHLSKTFRVVRLDFPGFGGSSRPDDSWGVGEYAELTAKFLQKLKVESVYALIGHSFGGRVIIKGVASKLLSPDKVVLIGAAGVKASRTFKKEALKVTAKVGKAATALPVLRNLRTSLRKKLYDVAGNTDYLNAGPMRKIFINTINEDLLPYVSKITRPALLIWGENDTEAPVRDGKRMNEQLKNSTFVEIQDAGHFVYDDNLDAVTKELDRFL
jgi:pimeloyl-ACP methyl ester carboxylesterase